MFEKANGRADGTSAVEFSAINDLAAVYVNHLTGDKGSVFGGKEYISRCEFGGLPGTLHGRFFAKAPDLFFFKGRNDQRLT